MMRMMTLRSKIFFANLQQDLKLFIALNLILNFSRVLFIYLFAGQLTQETGATIGQALFLGLRLSLKTAGALTLGVAAFTTLPATLWGREVALFKILRRSLTLIILAVLILAAAIKIPYYEIYNSNFDLHIFNFFRDDKQAIFLTAYQEYGLLWRLSLSIGAIILLAKLIFVAYDRPLLPLPKLWQNRPYLATSLFLLVFIVGAIFIRFGGALKYAKSVNWENCARFKNNLLNEAVLDEVQALYRAKSIQKRLLKQVKKNLTPEKVQASINLLGGKTTAGNIETAFVQTTKGGYFSKPPQHVIVIVGETYAEWPFMEPYRQMGLVAKGEQLRNSFKAVSVPVFLPAGDGTMTTLNAVITGMVDVNLAANYQPQSYKEIYATAIGQQMRALGYKTYFWYGGYASWQNIKKFTEQQGFDKFVETSSNSENKDAWGCPDAELFKQIQSFINNTQGQNEKYFHVILTTSNHPPYTVDLDNTAFPAATVRANLPANIANNEQKIKELGHIWYADQEMGKFIEQVEQSFPDSLFVITGDHAERFEFKQQVSAAERSLVPCVFYGAGLKQEWFQGLKYGNSVQIAPTLIELLAPSGHKYTNYNGNLLNQQQDFTFNYLLYAETEKLEKIENANTAQREKIAAWRTLAAWRILKGNNF